MKNLFTKEKLNSEPFLNTRKQTGDVAKHKKKRGHDNRRTRLLVKRCDKGLKRPGGRQEGEEETIRDRGDGAMGAIRRRLETRPPTRETNVTTKDEARWT